MGIWARMKQWEHDGHEAQIAVVGAGYVARGLLQRLERSPGLRPALVVNRTVESGVLALEFAGLERRRVVVSDDADALAEAIAAGRPAVTSDFGVLAALAAIDVVVEATGAIDHGASVMLQALESGKNVVSINAEVDVTIGYLLHRVARDHGAIYTFADGDQPGVLLRHIEFVEGMGFEIVAAVNCKRYLDVHQTPASGEAYATRDGTSPAMTTSAGDGTKMQIENAVVANVRGLPPDCRAMHGVPTTLEHAQEDVLAALSRRGVVEYTLGGDFGAGVFVIGRALEHEKVQRYMRYFKMGDGPDYLFFRPYHLVHLEMPVTIAELVLDRIPLDTPTGPPVAEVVTIAKRDLEPGELLDGIGGYTCYGQIDTIEGAEGLLPIGLTEHARMRSPVVRDQPIALDAVDLAPEAYIVQQRFRQDELVRSMSSKR